MSPVLGYCWPQSVLPGEEVDLYLGAESPSTVTVQIVRDGLDPQVVWRHDVIEVGPQPIPDDAPEAGCAWSPSVHFVVEPEWSSGMYVVRVAESSVGAWFVVRSPEPTPGAPLLKLATNTWNAYNDVGGRNLYSGAVLASPLRPLAAGFLDKPSGDGDRVVDDTDDFLNFAIDNELSLWHGMSGWAGQERRFVQWAEAAGIDVDYATDADLDDPRGAALLDGRRLLLSVGHDEYWTASMRDHVEGLVAEGGNVAFFSGNTAYWQVRLEDVPMGDEPAGVGPVGDGTTAPGGQVMVAFKHRFREDPVMGTDAQHLVTTMWADPLTGRPEAEMTGVSFTRGGYHRVHLSAPTGAAGYEIQRPWHWLLEGTGLERGDLLGTEDRIVGYECDGTELTVRDGLLSSTGGGGTPADFVVVATAPATAFDEATTPLPVEEGAEYELEFHAQRLLGTASAENLAALRHGFAVLGTWSDPDSGGTVVTVGCTEWAYGLGDRRVARVTRNVLARLGGVRGRAASPTIDNLAITWASIDELCADLSEEEWDRATGCPGWSVKDNVSHLIDFEASALGWPRPFHEVGDLPHVRNEIGAFNEVGVDARRGLTGAEVLEEFRRTVSARDDQLRALAPSDLDRDAMTPTGPGTVAKLLRMRLMDTWSHEQDIRRALRRPGHTEGPAVAESVEYFAGTLPYVVGKRAAAPDGTTVTFDIDGTLVLIEVADGRARRVEEFTDTTTDAPTVTLTMPAATLSAAIGGRSDTPEVGSPEGIVITGDTTLGRSIAAELGVMP